MYAVQVSERNVYEGMFMLPNNCRNIPDEGNDANVSNNWPIDRNFYHQQVVIGLRYCPFYVGLFQKANINAYNF